MVGAPPGNKSMSRQSTERILVGPSATPYWEFKIDWISTGHLKSICDTAARIWK
jgi:hypothetical protein